MIHAAHLGSRILSKVEPRRTSGLRGPFAGNAHQPLWFHGRFRVKGLKVMKVEGTKRQVHRYEQYLQNTTGFLRDLLDPFPDGLWDDDDYIQGSQRIDFYPELQRAVNRIDLEADEIANKPKAYPHEEALLDRIGRGKDYKPLILVGGLGAGKSTTVRYITRILLKRVRAGVSTCACGKSPCPRTPLIVDCLGIGEAKKKKAATRQVLKKLRFAIYTRLVEEWLAPHGLDAGEVRSIDNEYIVLRRLLITNDIARWAGPIHPNRNLEFRASLLDLQGNLLERTPTLPLVRELVEQYRGSALLLDDQIHRLTESSEQSRDFMRLLLEFYVSRCAPTNPLNIVVLDNLDELPTGQIENIVDELHDVAAEAPHLQLLIPLRPSSVANRTYKQIINFRYHWGPNNFALVLQRLSKYVLHRSRPDLLNGESFASPWPMGCKPTEEEYRSFLCCIYIYALILSAGKEPERDPTDVLRPLLHSDHKFLTHLEVSDGPLRELAIILDALVGRCCRYALDHAQRFVTNFYTRPIILPGLIARLETDLPTKIPIAYGNLVYTLIAENSHPIPIPRVSNLFLPARSGAHPNLPSLTKLRILSYLKGRPRMRVHDLLARLTLHGIPAEATIDALNSLQNKFRLLVWFSKNRELRPTRSRDLEQDVVMSEHGHEYFRRVLGNFEYVWYCAAELADRDVSVLSLTFRNKLEEYLRLVDLVGETEWKQIAFHRASENANASLSDHLDVSEMITLRLLYSTLATAVGSLEIALGLRRSGEYRRGLETLVQDLTEKIRVWQSRYERCYGGTGYLVLYKPFLDQVEGALASLDKRRVLSEEVSQDVRSLAGSWASDPAQSRSIATSYHGNQASLSELVADTGGDVPGLRELTEELAGNGKATIFLLQFLRARRSLHDLISRRLPTFRQLVEVLKLMILNAEKFIDCAPPAGRDHRAVEWLVGEEQRLRTYLDRFGHNSYVVPELCYEEEMSDLKDKFNNISGIVLDIAVREGIGDLWHLQSRWTP